MGAKWHYQKSIVQLCCLQSRSLMSWAEMHFLRGTALVVHGNIFCSTTGNYTTPRRYHGHRSDERSIDARRNPFAPLSGRTGNRSRKSRPLRPHEPNISTKPKNRRNRPSKPTGPSHGQNGKCFYTAWTPSRHSGSSSIIISIYLSLITTSADL